MQYQEAIIKDVPALADIRSADWETVEYWTERITAYMNGELHPQKALAPRIIYIARDNKKIIGFIAGHLTQRFNCEGELEWIDVVPAYRRKGIASELVRMLAKWFIEHNACKICVNSGADNKAAHQFYKNNGAVDLQEHWLIWKDISVAMKK